MLEEPKQNPRGQRLVMPKRRPATTSRNPSTVERGRRPTSMTSSPGNETKQPESALIVGAGIIGATTALYLAREGVAVTLVDRHHAGWGASGRNAGYIS